VALFDLTAFCDESLTEDLPPRTFGLAGYAAPALVWGEVERQWTQVLTREHLTEFHAAPCAKGRDEFAQMSQDRRNVIWREFRAVIASTGMHGFGSIIDLDAYAALTPTWQQKRPKGFTDPYYLAFQHQVELIASAAIDFPDTEQIRFVFDRRKQNQEQKAQRLYSGVQGSRKLRPFARRLGALRFCDSEARPGLQAADMLAYEIRRHFWEVVFPAKPKPIRWQWEALRPMNVRFFNNAAIATYAGIL
jgi:Protein of unknown function (DUF3800)